MRKKVVIGILAKHYPIDRNNKDTFIRDEIKQAVFDNGAIAIGILSPEKEIHLVGDNWNDNLTEEEKTNLITQIKLCDGIIAQGGLENDNYESWVARYAYENDIPILGICAGQNNIVRALGGTTYKISNPEEHNVSFDNYVHSVTIKKDSKIYNIIGKEKIRVNSRHQRTIKECPKLEMVGFCDDNYCDIVESPDKKFYVGVRFHPESLYKKDQYMNNIFIALINACSK